MNVNTYMDSGTDIDMDYVHVYVRVPVHIHVYVHAFATSMYANSTFGSFRRAPISTFANSTFANFRPLIRFSLFLRFISGT